jgi:glycosyltransferase involved in cell wall biosynthesis
VDTSYRYSEEPLEISVVIPTYNERESLGLLHAQISQVLAGRNYEILFVDDGSTDGSDLVLDELCEKDAKLRVLRYARNFGKSAALQAGFRESRGQIVITMDADLQDDPAEIPNLLAEMAKGYDLVSGWKVHRQDPLSKTLPSRFFNVATAKLTGIPLHDFNCGFKAYRRKLVENLNIYGEQHRFIPAIAYWRGFRVTEVGVNHHPRSFGRSKFGARRFWSGFIDLVTILYLTRFLLKPLHLFGSVGVACFGVGVVINLYLTYLRFSGETIGTRPLLQLGVLLMVMGIQFLSMGLLGEMITLRSARRGEEEKFYAVIERRKEDNRCRAQPQLSETHESEPLSPMAAGPLPPPHRQVGNRRAER